MKKSQVHLLLRAKREAMKESQVNKLPRAKRKANKEKLVDELPRAKMVDQLVNQSLILRHWSTSLPL